MSIRRRISRRANSVPGLGSVLARTRKARGQRFDDSTTYWDEHYARGGNSGEGSYGLLALEKARVLNQIVADRKVTTVLEIGCGDGNQLSLAQYPEYVGADISPVAIAACRERFATETTKRFIISGREPLPTCELGLSLDVIYHLVEDVVFEAYMAELLAHSSRMVVLYTSDSDIYLPARRESPHIRHRAVGKWMTEQQHWKLVERIPNSRPFEQGNEEETSFADFYIYERM